MSVNYNRIKSLQKENGVSDIQERINDGSAWKLEGSFGREAMAALRSGACMLPKKVYYDAYNNRVPSRDEVKSGTVGSYQNSVEFWNKVENGQIHFD